MKKGFNVRLIALLLAVVICIPAVLTVKAEPSADYTLELSATNAKCSRTNLINAFGDSLTSTAYYGISALGDSSNITYVTLISSYSVPSAGLYTVYKTTVATGSILNKKPDWTQATTKTVNIRLYYTATCSVSGHDEGELYLNGESVSGSVKLYTDTEYTFTAKSIDDYVYTITGAEDGTAFTPSANITVSAAYIKDAYAVINLSVGEGGTAQVISDGVAVVDKVQEGKGFTVEANPDSSSGYYLESIVIDKGGEALEGNTVESVADGETYNITVTFAQVTMTVPDLFVNYIDILTGNYSDIEDAIKAAVVIDDEEFASGAQYEIEYVTGKILGVDVYEDLDYSPILPSNHKFGYSNEDKTLEVGNTETVRVNVTNEAFPGIKLTGKATATVVDLRIPTTITSSNITITYGDDLKAAVMEAITITGDDGETVEFGDSKITINPETLNVKLLQRQDVTVSFSGDETYAASNGTVSVYVRQAPSDIDVKNETITYGETPALEVTTDPEGLDYLMVVAGIDADAKGFISIYIPESTREAMKVDIGGYTVLDLYEIISNGMGDGISLTEFRNILSNIATLLNTDIGRQAAENMGINPEVFSSIMDIINQIPDLDVNASITIGNPPKNAGLYLVGAVTADMNYRLSADIGYLTILQKTSTEEETVELEFKNVIGPGNHLTYEESQDFEFGGNLVVNGEVIDSDHIVAAYTGVQLDGTPVALTTEPIRYPGVYTETIAVIGGNYLPVPIIRVYNVGPIPVTVDVTCAETVVYGEIGNPGIEAAQLGTVVTGLPEGETLNTNPFIYLNPNFPHVGTYTVGATYSFNPNYNVTVNNATLKIVPLKVDIAVEDAEKTYGEPNPEFDYNVVLTGTDTDAFKYNDKKGAARIPGVTLGTDADETSPAGTYDIVGTPGEKAFWHDYEIVNVRNGVLTVNPKGVIVKIESTSKKEGEDDPEYKITVTDEDGNPLDPEEIGLVITREAGEGKGRYKFTVTINNGNFALDVDQSEIGTLDIVDPDEPKTGDENNLVIWLTLMAASGIAIAAICLTTFKKKEEEK